MSERPRFRDREIARGVGGVYGHLIGTGGSGLCGYSPARGWAETNRKTRDMDRLLCRECVRFAEMERDGE